MLYLKLESQNWQRLARPRDDDAFHYCYPGVVQPELQLDPAAGHRPGTTGPDKLADRM